MFVGAVRALSWSEADCSARVKDLREQSLSVFNAVCTAPQHALHFVATTIGPLFACFPELCENIPKVVVELG